MWNRSSSRRPVGRSSSKGEMTKSHKLFHLINQISVTRVWGHTCRGKDWSSSCPFYLWLCCVASGWHEQRGILSYIELTLLSDTFLIQRSHPQCLIAYQPLDAPAKPVFTFSSPNPRCFADHPPARLLITLEFYLLSATLSCICRPLSESRYFAAFPPPSIKASTNLRGEVRQRTAWVLFCPWAQVHSNASIGTRLWTVMWKV